MNHHTAEERERERERERVEVVFGIA